MTDAPTPTPSDANLESAVSEIAEMTKKGFDLQARLRGRGLRKATITLFLDEQKGPELGWAYNVENEFNQVVGRAREGVVGDIDRLQEELAVKRDEWRIAQAAAEALVDKEQKAANAKSVKDAIDSAEETYASRYEELEARRVELLGELIGTAIVINMTAVPNVIQKDTRRRAKETIGITEKGVPDDRKAEFNLAQTAHLMTVMFKLVTDNETGDANDVLSYDDAIALMDYLPLGQFRRLDQMMGQVQFTDAISLSIEGQEDFS